MVQVTFVGLDGEVIKTEDVVLGHTVVFPADPAVDGYEFTGWFLENGDPIPEVLKDYYKPARTLKVCAHFKELVYITLMNGDEVYQQIQAIKGDEFTFSVEPPEKENYTFSGWYLNANNTDAPYDGTLPDEDTTLYAHFTNIELFEIETNSKEKTCSIKGMNAYYLNKVTELVVPEAITKNGVSYRVTGISNAAFKGNKKIESISLPASITTIGENAFTNCTALKNITVAENNAVYESRSANCIVEKASQKLIIGCQSTTIYDGVLEIAENAFLDCKNLKALHIPASVKTISEGFLSGCTALESLTVDAANADYISVDNCLIRLSDTCVIQGCKTSVLPKEFKVGDEDKAISSISAKAFAGCTGLKEIKIPESISTLKANTFKGCTALAKITVNNLEMVIEENAFAGCSAITDITVPYSLVKTFLALSKKTLTKVTLLDGEAIEENLFEGYSTLEAVTLPTTVQTIGAYAFSGCGLKALNLAENASLTSIGYKAFANCKALVEINLPSGVSEVDYDAFSGCTALTKASLGADIMRCLLVAASNITELNITSGEALDYETVRALTALESLSLSKNIATVDARSLRACTKLVNITIAAENTTLKVENNYVLEIATGKLVFAAAKTVITLSESVKTIGAYAFVGTGIEEIVIPATVEKIENFAFTACRSLKKLEILGEPTIEEFAFEGCDAIETVKAYESAFAYLNQVTIKTKDIIPSADDGDEPNA